MEFQLITPYSPNENQKTLVERVFLHRGMTSEELHHYLHTNYEDILNPLKLDNIEEGIKMLIYHISEGHDILVQVDSDADGYTSAAAFINYLYHFFPAYVLNHLTYRLHDGKQHGIILETIPSNIKLVVAPDSASNNYEEHAALKKRGCNVLVLDHHHADKESKDACIINNQISNYPNKDLSGVGVVYKFCSQMDKLFPESERYAEQILDLTAVGIISDVMDLRQFETREIIRKGLSNVVNPFLETLAAAQDFSISRAGGLNPFSVAWYITPQINATIRMGTQKEKTTLFEAFLEHKGYEKIPSTKRGEKGKTEYRVTQAVRNCSNIKNRQAKARDEGLVRIERLIEKEDLLKNKILIVKLLPPTYVVNKNLTGLIANMLMAKYQKPVLLLNRVENEGVISWEGSGRNCGIDNFRQFLIDTNLVMYAEGHADAFGTGILDKDFEHFVEYTNNVLKDYNFNTSYKVDFIFQGWGDLAPEELIELAELNSIWGQGIEKPLLAIKGLNLSRDMLDLLSRNKKPTLKITLPIGVEFIKFGSSEEEYETLLPSDNLKSTTINVVCSCDINTWGGRVTPQLKIEEYEITNTNMFYF